MLILLISCKRENKEYNPAFVEGSTIKSLNFNDLEGYIKNHPAETLVVNFWATWCAPCVKELPTFEKLGETYANKDVKVLLVSLDFPEQLEKLTQFVENKKIQSEVIFLNDGDANEWIPKVDRSWSGAIPATLVVGVKNKKFYERSFNFSQLENELKSVIN